MESDYESDSNSSLDSLFDDIPSDHAQRQGEEASLGDIKLTKISSSPITGLYFDPTVRLSLEHRDDLFKTCLQKYFQGNNDNQVMLFERVSQKPEGKPRLRCE